jgi:molybdopterin molybdotransferase
MVTFCLFGLPLLRTMQGDRAPLPLTVRAALATAITRKPGRLEFMRAQVHMKEGELMARTLPNQASGAITSMAWADALAIIPADAASLAQGAIIDVLRFRDA